MLRITCDRCGKDMTESGKFGYISVGFTPTPFGEEIEGENPHREKHFCIDCMEEINSFILKAPAKTMAGEAKESEGNTGETERKAVKTERRPEPRTFDLAKAMALRAAGWKLKDIASELHTDITFVSKKLNKEKDRLRKLAEEAGKEEA